MTSDAELANFAQALQHASTAIRASLAVPGPKVDACRVSALNQVVAEMARMGWFGDGPLARQRAAKLLEGNDDVTSVKAHLTDQLKNALDWPEDGPSWDRLLDQVRTNTQQAFSLRDAHDDLESLRGIMEARRREIAVALNVPPDADWNGCIKEAARLAHRSRGERVAPALTTDTGRTHAEDLAAALDGFSGTWGAMMAEVARLRKAELEWIAHPANSQLAAVEALRQALKVDNIAVTWTALLQRVRNLVRQVDDIDPEDAEKPEVSAVVHMAMTSVPPDTELAILAEAVDGFDHEDRATQARMARYLWERYGDGRVG